MKVTQEETDYGPVNTVETAGQEETRVLYLGGWQQDPARMYRLQEILAVERGISSVGIGAVDTISPTQTVTMREALGYVTDDELLQNVPPRMLLRASIANQLSRTVLHRRIEPNVTLANCAAANVQNIANYLHHKMGDASKLPRRGVFAEPMLAEDISPREYFVAFARHERAAQKPDSDLISLRQLSKPTDKGFSPEEGRLPVEDIVNSRGLTFFMKAIQTGSDYLIVVGDEADYAANETRIRTGLPAAMQSRVRRYTAQHLKGHGYLYAEPEAALDDIVPLILTTTEVTTQPA